MIVFYVSFGSEKRLDMCRTRLLLLFSVNRFLMFDFIEVKLLSTESNIYDGIVRFAVLVDYSQLPSVDNIFTSLKQLWRDPLSSIFSGTGWNYDTWINVDCRSLLSICALTYSLQ